MMELQASVSMLLKSSFKKHNVFLICPAKERSATSQALTIFHRIHVEKLEDTTYTVDGFPTDCVNIGFFGNIFLKLIWLFLESIVVLIWGTMFIIRELLEQRDMERFISVIRLQ